MSWKSSCLEVSAMELENPEIRERMVPQILRPSFFHRHVHVPKFQNTNVVNVFASTMPAP